MKYNDEAQKPLFWKQKLKHWNWAFSPIFHGIEVTKHNVFLLESEIHASKQKEEIPNQYTCLYDFLQITF